MIKILNLYAGIGGNRKLWTGDIEVTAVEINQEIAAIYKDFFPQDNIIVGDAHQYLLDHYAEFDFIWSSPPCVTHTRINRNFNNVRYIDMNLYTEIVLLETWFKGKYCVENVIPYYKPLIPAQQVDRHLYWCNFKIHANSVRNPQKEVNLKAQKKSAIGRYNKDVYNNHVWDLSKLKIRNKRQVVSNCVNPKTGKMILDCAFKDIQATL
jgi:DNA (cytosine-5)-methyltransferase 1